MRKISVICVYQWSIAHDIMIFGIANSNEWINEWMNEWMNEWSIHRQFKDVTNNNNIEWGRGTQMYFSFPSSFKSASSDVFTIVCLSALLLHSVRSVWTFSGHYQCSESFKNTSISFNDHCLFNNGKWKLKRAFFQTWIIKLHQYSRSISKTTTSHQLAKSRTEPQLICVGCTGTWKRMTHNRFLA